MNVEEFKASLRDDTPRVGMPVVLEALWWDAKGEWAKAHALVDELESAEGMAVHAYLNRKEGAGWNAEYWYRRAGVGYRREEVGAEWEALVEGLVGE